MNIDAFPQRLKQIIGDSSVNKFAKKCGFHESLIRKYLTEGSLPSIDKAMKIAEIAAVSIEWLATGQGPMKKGESSTGNSENPPARIAPAPLDETLLQAVLISVKEALKDKHPALTPAQEARLVSTLYKMRPALPLDKSTIKQLLDLTT